MPDESPLLTPDVSASEYATDAPEAGEPETEIPSELADEGESSDVDAFTALDPNTFPPELKSAYKRMQADYTRKTQEIATQRHALQALQQKAAYFDQFTPYLSEFQAFMQSRQRPAPTHGPPEEPVVDYSTMTPEQIVQHEVSRQVKEQVTAYQQAIAQQLQPIQQFMQQQVLRNVQETYNQQVQSAFTEFGEENVQAYAEPITQIVSANPQLSVADAYKIVAFGQAKAQGANTVYTALEAKKKAGSIERPTGRAAPPARGKPSGDAFLDAVREAKAELVASS